MSIRRVFRLSPLALSLAATPLFAKTFTVNQFTDAGDSTCDATCTLRDALDDANNTPGPDIIKFTASTAVRSITLAAGQELLITDAVSVIGPHPGLLTVSGNNSSRIFILSTATGKDVVISGMTLTNGNGTGLNDPGVDGKGGAIFNNSADLVMSDIALTGNTASTGGGAFILGGIRHRLPE